MGYHIDTATIDLNALQKRIQSTDLIPSQEPLLDGLTRHMKALEQVGMHSVADLMVALKTAKLRSALSQNSGVSVEYLNVLRRTINGFVPKPRPLNEMSWLKEDMIASLNEAGIRHTQHLFDAVGDPTINLADLPNIGKKDLKELIAVSDLCRIQWVSPNYARALVAVGYRTASAVAKADPEKLLKAIADANEHGTFYRGKIGLRDVMRLVNAAHYAA